VSGPATFAWLARHEFRLAWRDLIALLTGGRRGRLRIVIGAALTFFILMHLLAYAILAEALATGIPVNEANLFVVTGCGILAWSLMISQAIEMVTRAFYARADLDLILSSPASARRLFAVRVLAITASTTFMAVPMTSPFINVLAYWDSPGWLSAYGVLVAMGAVATALAMALTVGLFATIGPKRTRLLAQIIAAVVGAAFVIGVQAAAIFSTGTLSRLGGLRSPAFLDRVPDLESPFWWPARAAIGNLGLLLAILLLAFGILAICTSVFSIRFADYATAAAGIASARSGRVGYSKPFRNATPATTLRRKEWVLLRRDPWLVSQTLIQILYLTPPALLLWRNFGEGQGALSVLVPVVVMAAGQLAGGLAWLAVSGEDAPDLVASAPVRASGVLRAKIEAVTGGIAIVVLPLNFFLVLASPLDGLICLGGVLVAATSATLIQLWFRTQARRSQFRRRQTSSKIATFAEALSSIAWAGTAFLVTATSWLALIPGTAALCVLVGARAVRPR
jgi:ABC-2 type transport system permease protein